MEFQFRDSDLPVDGFYLRASQVAVNKLIEDGTSANLDIKVIFKIRDDFAWVIE